MALYPAVYDWLVGADKPLGPHPDGIPGHLFWARLPKDNGRKGVVVAVIPIPGTTPEYYLGSRELDDPAGGVTDDAGVLWYRAGLLFLARSLPGYELLASGILDRVMHRMEMLRDGSRLLPVDLDVAPFNGDKWAAHGEPATQEVLEFAGTTSPPNLLEQDSKERLVFQLQVEIRHRPAAFDVGIPYEVDYSTAGGVRFSSAGFIDWTGLP